MHPEETAKQWVRVQNLGDQDIKVTLAKPDGKGGYTVTFEGVIAPGVKEYIADVDRRS